MYIFFNLHASHSFMLHLLGVNLEANGGKSEEKRICAVVRGAVSRVLPAGLVLASYLLMDDDNSTDTGYNIQCPIQFPVCSSVEFCDCMCMCVRVCVRAKCACACVCHLMRYSMRASVVHVSMLPSNLYSMTTSRSLSFFSFGRHSSVPVIFSPLQIVMASFR